MIGPRLLGEDLPVGRIEQIMDHTILGHAYAKSPVDVVRDILGKATGQPLWMLLGGKLPMVRRCIASPRRHLMR